jgi:hypothetical protein
VSDDFNPFGEETPGAEDRPGDEAGAEAAAGAEEAVGADETARPDDAAAPALGLPDSSFGIVTPEEGAALPLTEAEIVTPQEINELGGMLTTAATLLPEDEEETPPPPEHSQPPPPGEIHGPFIVQKVKGYGDGYRDLILDQLTDTYVPVGIWLNENYPVLTPGAVEQMLTEMGLPEERADKYRRHRQLALDAQKGLSSSEALQHLKAEEDRHWNTKELFSQAFVEKQKRGQK